MPFPKAQHAQAQVSQEAAATKSQNIPLDTPDAALSVASNETQRATCRLLRRPDVEARTGLSRSTIYAWMQAGDFPQPVKLGARLVAWRETDITAWLQSREEREG